MSKEANTFVEAVIENYLLVNRFATTNAIVAHVTIQLHPTGYKISVPADYKPDFPALLEAMVSKGALKEVEYISADMDYRVKSIYFLATTQLKIRSTEDMSSLFMEPKS